MRLNVHKNLIDILHTYGEFNIGRIWIGALYYATGIPYLLKSIPPFAEFLHARVMAIETVGAALRQINRLFTEGAITGLSDAQLLDRFLAERDGAAFEMLMARHGPMVLSVCRGVLKDPNDAEDAFQVAFLILVKKSGTFRGHVALGPWLYRVSYRVALRANAAAARRRDCERRAGQMAAATSAPGPAGPDETIQALYHEIQRLPEALRHLRRDDLP